jgi:hypothetical protein
METFYSGGGSPSSFGTGNSWGLWRMGDINSRVVVPGFPQCIER